MYQLTFVGIYPSQDVYQTFLGIPTTRCMYPVYTTITILVKLYRAFLCMVPVITCDVNVFGYTTLVLSTVCSTAVLNSVGCEEPGLSDHKLIYGELADGVEHWGLNTQRLCPGRTITGSWLSLMACDRFV